MHYLLDTHIILWYLFVSKKMILKTGKILYISRINFVDFQVCHIKKRQSNKNCGIVNIDFRFMISPEMLISLFQQTIPTETGRYSK